ncbi:MAG: hypothetical protein H6509_14660 [Bryobacterales bacterium]|nr:hypothetical protein [Bryobacterales bacterium]
MISTAIVVEFSGQDFFEQDRPVTLERMTFWRRDGRTRLALGAVPRILLLEAYRDFRQIAHAGDG